MGIFPSLIRSTEAPAPSDDFWYYSPLLATESGIAVNEKTALTYLTVFACVSLIAGDIARLPLNLYRRRTDGGKDLVTDHALFDLLHNAPNEETTSMNWREAAQGHLLLWGNHYSYIERDNADRIKALWVLSDPSQVRVKRVQNRLIYEYWVDGEKRTRTRNEIFHIAGYGFNGLYGLSPISMAREAIGVGLSAEKFGGMFFSEGTHPSVVVTIPPEVDLGNQEEEYRKKLKETIAGLKNAHGIAVMQNGEKVDKLTMPLEDAQFLETRDHQKIEICGMYHVPPHKIAIHGQNSNYNNLEQENASYVDSCLMHWLVRWESQISLQLLSEQERKQGLFFEFLVQGLLRGDSTARADYYSKIFAVGSITPNEIRQKENMNPIEGGDDAFVQLSYVPIKDAKREPPPVMPEEEPEEEEPNPERSFEKRALKTFFNRPPYQRSVQLFSKLQASYRGLIRRAADEVISRETIAIKKAANRMLKQRTRTEFEEFLDGFYMEHREYVRTKFDPVFRAYSEVIYAEATAIIGSEAIMTPSMEKFQYDYFQKFAVDHCQKGHDEIMSIVNKSLDEDALLAVVTRADEWFDKAPDKIATDQANRLLGAVQRETWKENGIRKLRWVTVGQTCPFCTKLEGMIVEIEKDFIKGGAVLYVNKETGESSWYDPDTGKYSNSIGGSDQEVQSMKFYNSKAHPPIHQGCDCKIMPA